MRRALSRSCARVRKPLICVAQFPTGQEKALPSFGKDLCSLAHESPLGGTFSLYKFPPRTVVGVEPDGNRFRVILGYNPVRAWYRLTWFRVSY